MTVTLRAVLPSIRVVVVTWNGAHLLSPCLASLAAQTLPPEQVEVVVVDNASTDGTLELLAREHPGVRVVPAATNTGFAGGCALGLADLEAEFAVLLNNDARAEPDYLERLVAAARRPGWEHVGAVSATVLLDERFREVPRAAPGDVVTADGRAFRPGPDGDVELVNSTGNVVRTDGYGTDRGWLVPRHEHEPPAEVFGFCGAAALLRRRALEDTGGFDASLFLYYEDTDLSWRLRLRGWSVRHTGEAVVRHRHGASSVEGSSVFRFHNDRNRLAVVTKDATAGLALRCVLRYPLTALSLAVQERFRPAPTRLRLRVVASYLRMLPALLDQRRRVGARAVVRRRDVEGLLVAAEHVGGYRQGWTEDDPPPMCGNGPPGDLRSA